jgi:hypothetical protein
MPICKSEQMTRAAKEKNPNKNKDILGVKTGWLGEMEAERLDY